MIVVPYIQQTNEDQRRVVTAIDCSVYFDNKIAHEGEITILCTHTGMNANIRAVRLGRANTHDRRVIHSTNQRRLTHTYNTVVGASPLIVVYLDSKIAHEGDITTSTGSKE